MIPDKVEFWNWPASYHNRAGSLNFADGHSEIKRWRDSRTMPPLGGAPAMAKPQAQTIKTSFGCCSTAPEGNPESFPPVFSGKSKDCLSLSLEFSYV
jgi:hypothetical protein